MPEIRRTIMNTLKDAQECQIFVMILKQKWSEFDEKLKKINLMLKFLQMLLMGVNIPHI